MHELVIIVARFLVAIPPLVGLALFLSLKKAQRPGFVVYALLSVAITVLLVKVASSLHQDPRPFFRDGVQPYFKSSVDNGFPSDHTVFSAVIAGIVVPYWFKTGMALVGLAVLIGAARVVAGVHHGIDIVAGMIIAGVACAIALYFSRRFVKKTS
jgi:membrane-associated phospholipid phosphatase